MSAGVRGSQGLAERMHLESRRRRRRGFLVQGVLILVRLGKQGYLRKHLISVRFSLQLDVDDTAKDLRGKIVEGHLLVGDLIGGGLDLLDVALGKIEDTLALTRDGDERTSAGLPELVVERRLRISSGLDPGAPRRHFSLVEAQISHLPPKKRFVRQTRATTREESDRSALRSELLLLLVAAAL